MLQPGRTRLVFVHVLLENEAVLRVEEMDRLRDQLQGVLNGLHSTTQLDMLFTKNPKWVRRSERSRRVRMRDRIIYKALA